MIKKKLSLFYLFSIMILFGQQENEIEKIIIEGKTVSKTLFELFQNVQVVTKEDILKTPAVSIAEILAYYSGIDIRQRGVHGVQADISIRGSSFDQVLVLVNGIRMNDSQSGHNMMNLPFDLAAVERIEIIQGSAARRFGQNAYAGAINIVTKLSKRNDITISVNGGEYETYSLGAGLNWSGRRFSQFLQTETSQSKGYRYNTDYLGENVWYQNKFQLNNGDIHLQAGIVDKKFGANGFYSSSFAKDQYEQIQTSLVSGGWNQKFNNLKINTNIYWRRSQDEYIFVRSNPSLYRNLHLGNNIGLEVNTNYISKYGTTGLGTDIRKEFLSSNNLGNRERTVKYVFIEHQLTFFNDKLDITPGVSFSEYSDFGGFWYPGVDAGFRINSHNKIFTNFGKTYRIPSYTDLFYIDKLNEGNPDLKPENALNYELGYKFTDKNIVTAISVFQRDSKNLIDWVKQNEEDKWKPENVAKVSLKGVEIDFKHRFYASFVKSYNIGYTYLDNNLKYPASNYSRYLLENLKHQLIMKLELGIFRKITNQLIYRYNDRVLLGNYHLLDNKLSFQNEKFQLFIQVNNILNTKYTETNLLPMPGRWLQMGIVWKNMYTSLN